MGDGRGRERGVTEDGNPCLWPEPSLKLMICSRAATQDSSCRIPAVSGDPWKPRWGVRVHVKL